MKPKEDRRSKYQMTKLSELEYEMLSRISRSLHLNKSETTRQLVWREYDRLCRNTYHPESGILDSVPEDISELEELQEV